MMTTTGYQRIQEFYGDRVAMRSQVPLINHINEGIKILERIGAHQDTIEAYCIHPLVQADDDLAANYTNLVNGTGGSRLFPPITANVLALAMEYRSVANDFLSGKIYWENGPSHGSWELKAAHPIRLSPLEEVNQMLIGDKVQNRKDFIAHHLASHLRSQELDFYFKMWLEALKVSEERYLELVEGL